MPKPDLLNNIPFVEAAKTAGKKRPSAIVVRTSWTSSDTGAANAIAQTWHSPNNVHDNSNYVVDDARVIRCMPDNVVSTFAKKGFRGAISVNVCHDPPEPPTTATLERTAKLVARLCKKNHIRPEVLARPAEKRWHTHQWRHRGGIIIATTGDFPISIFEQLMLDEYETL